MAGIGESEALFGRLVVEQGLATEAQVQECLSILSRLAEQGVTPLPRLGELLLRRGYMSPSQVEATLRASSPAKASAPSAPLPPEAAQAERDPANVLGRYVRVARLGAGGMGEVWKGWDRELRRWVALKLLKGEDPAEIARFEREAQTAAQLNHPNIAAVYEVGNAGGRAFIAMQLVSGKSLASYPRNDRRALVTLLRDAALAVHHAHGQGVIHRDLKPHNLMVEASRVYVLDFGLAKQTSVESSLSVSGHVFGTPAYMPPEQARGRVHETDARSDVYSLGATLYELLTDRPPFNDKDVWELLRKVAEEDPLPPRKTNPKVEPDLETVILKCLEKDPARRYPDAQALADDLTRWLEGRAIEAHPPSVLYRFRKFAVRKRAVLIPAAAAVLIAIVAAVWIGRGSAQKAAQDAAIKTIESARPVLDRAYRYLYDPKASYAELARRVESARKTIEATLGDAPDLAVAHYHLGRCWDLLGHDDRAEASYRSAIRLDPDFGPPRYLLGRLLLIRAYLVSRRGHTDQQQEARRPEAERIGREAAKELEAAQGRSGFEEEIQKEISAAMLAYVRGDMERTVRLAKAGIEKYKTAEGVEEFHWLVALGARGNPEVRGPAIDEALRIRPNFPLVRYPRYLDRDEEEDIIKATEFAPRVPMFRFGRATAHFKRKNYAAALEQAEEALKLDPKWPEALSLRGQCRYSLGNIDAALADYDEAVRVEPTAAGARRLKAALFAARGETDRALAEYDEALRHQPNDKAALLQRSRIKRDRKDVAGALADLDRAIQIDPAYADGFEDRAYLKSTTKDAAGARADYDQAIRLEPTRVSAWAGRAYHRSQNKDLDGAMADYNEAIRIDPANAQYLGNRASLHRLKKAVEDGLKDARAALAIDTAQTVARFEIVELLAQRATERIQKKDRAGAFADLEEAMKTDPKHAAAWRARGLVRVQLGEFDAAIPDLRESLKLLPGQANVHYSIAWALAQKGDEKGALAEYTECVRVDPGHFEGLAERALLLGRSGRIDEGMRDAEEAVRRGPTFAPAWNVRAALKLEKNDLRGAEADSTEALKLDPASWQARVNRVTARMEQGKLKDAAEDAEELVRTRAELPESWLLRGETKRLLKDTKGAAEDYRKALQLAPKEWPQRAGVEAVLQSLR
jgi:tetratricopeptide (TPR) repeat protein/predicted Ser/Thr protein kinase